MTGCQVLVTNDGDLLRSMNVKDGYAIKQADSTRPIGLLLLQEEETKVLDYDSTNWVLPTSIWQITLK